MKEDTVVKGMIHVVSTTSLFKTLNRNNKVLTERDNPLLASKLGILFALSTGRYVDFKGEFVELDTFQLDALADIVDQHFAVDLYGKLDQLVVNRHEIPAISPTKFPVPTHRGKFFSKIKRFMMGKGLSLQETRL